MSIFFSPDEPKYVDSHTGRLTRFNRGYSSFSREKDNTLVQKTERSKRTMQVVPECTELRSIRESFDSFIEMFAVFNKQNGPAITGNYMSNNFLHFKAAFEPFILHSSHYFNSSAQSQKVRRYSPLLQFSAKLLREWAILVSTMNKLSRSKILPHLHQIQVDFEALSKDISTVSAANTRRTYYRDTFFASSNYLKAKITSTYQAIYDILSVEYEKGYSKHQLQILQEQVVLLNRDIIENYLGLLPSSLTTTPEMTRTSTHMKAACGDIVALLDASFYFRKRMFKIQEQMCELHGDICKILDRLQIRYEIEVAPLGYQEPIEEEDEDENEESSPVHKVESFVNDMSELLGIDLEGQDPIDDLGTIQTLLKQKLSPTSQYVKSQPIRKSTKVETPRKTSKVSESQRITPKHTSPASNKTITPRSARSSQKSEPQSARSTKSNSSSNQEKSHIKGKILNAPPDATIEEIKAVDAVLDTSDAIIDTVK